MQRARTQARFYSAMGFYLHVETSASLGTNFLFLHQQAVTHGSAAASSERIKSPLSRNEDRKKRTESWEDGSDACNSHVLALTSRYILI